jgi:hypothetical protein
MLRIELHPWEREDVETNSIDVCPSTSIMASPFIGPRRASSLKPFISPATPHIPAHGFTGFAVSLTSLLVEKRFVSSLKVNFHMHVAPFSVENSVSPSSDTSIKLKNRCDDDDDDDVWRATTSTGSESGSCLTLLSFHIEFPVDIKINPPEFTLIEVITSPVRFVALLLVLSNTETVNWPAFDWLALMSGGDDGSVGCSKSPSAKKGSCVGGIHMVAPGKIVTKGNGHGSHTPGLSNDPLMGGWHAGHPSLIPLPMLPGTAPDPMGHTLHVISSMSRYSPLETLQPCTHSPNTALKR